MNAKRLLKLADFLEKVHPSNFRMEDWVRGPRPKAMSREPTKAGEWGTTACAVGWCPAVFPRSAWEWRGVNGVVYGKSHGAFHSAQKFFGLDFAQANYLFCKYQHMKYTPKQEARKIRQFVAREGRVPKRQRRP